MMSLNLEFYIAFQKIYRSEFIPNRFEEGILNIPQINFTSIASFWVDCEFLSIPSNYILYKELYAVIGSISLRGKQKAISWKVEKLLVIETVFNEMRIILSILLWFFFQENF